MLFTSFDLDFGSKNQIYFDLLNEEDFDFKTKKIKIKVSLDKTILILIETESILNLKIANSAVIKSLEIIEKTLNL